ncbi:hypothetical protein BKA63DRAFT_535860 [Paraphoma chrysanthemicola]|nr:hypothetical protein BKA63DRAFT_535860 [Paraphoma chrysanthemicola]
MVPRQNIEEWERPWKTSDWPTLFGLIGLANDNRWEQTPLWFYKSMHEKWHQHNRPWMKRLLAMGVIPLYIQDGGMEQYRVNFSGFGLKKRFPYFTWPRYIQSKKRAYFEFIIPYCDQNQDRLDFLQEIIVNRTQQVTGYEQAVRDNSYGVTVRIAPPGRGAIYYSIPNPPCLQERPFEIGAQSALELFVPFKRDTVLKRAFAERCNAMAYFFRDCDASRIPLLQHADTILVRLEAKHYGSCELDTYVYSVAERVGLPILWPEVECREAAVKELELCGLPADGLRPFQLSESAAFH